MQGLVQQLNAQVQPRPPNMSRVLLLLTALATVTVVTGEKLRFDDCKVWTVLPISQQQLNVLRSLDTRDGFNFWREITGLGLEVDIMVPPHKLTYFKQLMADNQIASKVVVENVQKLIDAENPRADGKKFGWTNYHRLDTIYEWFDFLAAAHPQANVVVGGRTHEGREIRGVNVTFKQGNPTVFIEGGIHAREWIAPATVTYILNAVLTSTDKRVRQIVEAFNWYIFPNFNPDGYEYSHTHHRMWRKTRSPNEDSACLGIDGNRNFPWNGDLPGGSSDPCDEGYGGPAPFSAIEMKTLSDFLLRIPKIDVYLDFHSHWQLMMYPFGHENSKPAPNWKQLQAIADKAVAAIGKRYGTKYGAGNALEVSYAANGDTNDWAYRALNVSIVYTIELRPEAGSPYHFILPAEFIIPSGEETLDGVVSVLEDVRAYRDLR